MKSTDLDELVLRARQRAPDALSEIVDRYSARLYAFLYRLTGSRDAAEELLQETFLRMVRTIETYEHSGRFEAWLFRIAANLHRDRSRQLGRRGSQTPFDDAASRAVDRHVSQDGAPPAVAVRREESSRVAAALGRLSDAEREVLLLRHYSGLAFREIADTLGIPLGTALARAHRGLARLRAMLENEEE